MDVGAGVVGAVIGFAVGTAVGFVVTVICLVAFTLGAVVAVAESFSCSGGVAVGVVAKPDGETVIMSASSLLAGATLLFSDIIAPSLCNTV